MGGKWRRLGNRSKPRANLRPSYGTIFRPSIAEYVINYTDTVADGGRVNFGRGRVRFFFPILFHVHNNIIRRSKPFR